MVLNTSSHIENTTPLQVVERVLSGAHAKFVESVDIAINSSVSKKDGSSIRTYVVLPHKVSKSVRVAFFTDDSASAAEATAAGADIVAGDALISDILAGKIDFDVLVSTPKMMPKLSKVARIIGSKGLMPNAKLGTLTDKIALSIKEIKSGRASLKSDDHGTVHVKVGNVSMSASDILENIRSTVSAVVSGVGSSVSNFRIKSIYVSSTMGKGYPVSYSLLVSKK